MKYLIVESKNGLSALERANAINKELLRLTRPAYLEREGDVSSGIFRVIENLEKAALCYDENYVLRIHSNHNISKLVLLMGSEMGSNEIQQLAGVLATNKNLPFKFLIPRTSEVVDINWMHENGWIKFRPF